MGLGLAILSTVSALVLMRWGVWRCLRWCDLDVALDRVRAELLARFEPRGGLLRDVTGGGWVAVGTGGVLAGLPGGRQRGLAPITSATCMSTSLQDGLAPYRAGHAASCCMGSMSPGAPAAQGVVQVG